MYRTQQQKNNMFRLIFPFQRDSAALSEQSVEYLNHEKNIKVVILYCPYCCVCIRKPVMCCVVLYNNILCSK